MQNVRIDLDLRKLRSFVAVAERRHFGRAAMSLHVTQPALSRQVRQLEQDLRVTLFARNTRDVTLTPAGEQFLHDAKALLTAGQAAQDRARRAASGEHTLTVGFMLGTDTTAALDAFARDHPEVAVELVRLRWWNQAESLRDGSVDMGFVRLPIPCTGLRLLPLHTERLSVVLPADHPLAGEDEIDLAAVADEPVLRYADATPPWAAVWSADPRPDGTRPAHGPAFRDMEELLGYVKAGRGVAFVPESVAACFPRGDISYVPVVDLAPGQVALAWASAHQSEVVAGFAHAARAVDLPRCHMGINRV